MNGILQIYKLPTLQDWQRDGFYGNKDFGIKHCPTIKLLPFFFDVESITTLTVSTFTFQKVSQASTRAERLIADTVSLIGSDITVTASTFSNRFRYPATREISQLSPGYWQYYIKLSDDSEYISELICIPVAAEIIEVLPDFNNDFSDDFLI